MVGSARYPRCVAPTAVMVAACAWCSHHNVWPAQVTMVHGTLLTMLARIPFAGWVNEMHFVHGKRVFWALT